MQTSIKKKPVVRKRKTTVVKKTKGRVSKKDIKKKVESLVAKGQFSGDFDFDELSDADKYFCELYASDVEFFGNGVQSYIKAYKPNLLVPGEYKRVKDKARDLLAKPVFLAYVNHVMELGRLNDAFVDSQHAFLIVQNQDYNVKLGAIKHYDLKKGRITKKFKIDKYDHGKVTDEEKELIDEIFDID